MKKHFQKADKKFPFMNRFLSGLVIALALTLTAFEWTTVTTEERPENLPTRTNDIEEMLPPITYRPDEARKVLPEKPTDQVTIVEEIFTTKPEPIPAKNEPATNTAPVELPLPVFNPGHYGEEPEVDEDIIYESVQVFAHYKKCSGLTGSELQACSQQDIQQRIFKNFRTPQQLKAIGGKQGALVSFVVDNLGNITEVTVKQSTSKAMAKAATKAVESLPKMDFPANQQGRDVALRMSIPIVLNLK